MFSVFGIQQDHNKLIELQSCAESHWVEFQLRMNIDGDFLLHEFYIITTKILHTSRRRWLFNSFIKMSFFVKGISYWKWSKNIYLNNLYWLWRLLTKYRVWNIFADLMDCGRVRNIENVISSMFPDAWDIRQWISRFNVVMLGRWWWTNGRP